MKKNVLSMNISEEAIGGCTVSKMSTKTKKEENEMQYIKEEKAIPEWWMMGFYLRATDLESV